MYKYTKERAWIKKKLDSGISKRELLDSVGLFSNKSKKKVMQEKGLTEKQYNKRYKFLLNVFNILDSGL